MLTVAVVVHGGTLELEPHLRGRALDCLVAAARMDGAAGKAQPLEHHAEHAAHDIVGKGLLAVERQIARGAVERPDDEGATQNTTSVNDAQRHERRQEHSVQSFASPARNNRVLADQKAHQ